MRNEDPERRTRIRNEERGVGHGGKRTIAPRADRGEGGQLPGRYGIRGVNSGCADLEEVGSCGR